MDVPGTGPTGFCPASNPCSCSNEGGPGGQNASRCTTKSGGNSPIPPGLYPGHSPSSPSSYAPGIMNDGSGPCIDISFAQAKLN